MSNNIQLHKNDLPDDLDLGNLIAVDGEFMGFYPDIKFTTIWSVRYA